MGGSTCKTGQQQCETCDDCDRPDRCFIHEANGIPMNSAPLRRDRGRRGSVVDAIDFGAFGKPEFEEPVMHMPRQPFTTLTILQPRTYDGAGESTDDDVQASLFEAVRACDFRAVVEAVARGARVNYRNLRGYTPLMVAASAEVSPQGGTEGPCIEIVKFLLAAEARVDVRDKEMQYTPYLLACRVGNLEVIKLLTEARAHVKPCSTIGASPIMLAAWAGSYSVIRHLLEHRGNMNTQDKLGWSALVYACDAERVDTVRMLLKIKADTYDKGAEDFQISPLLVTAEHGNKEIAKMLLMHSGPAAVNIQDGDGNTALMYAIRNRYLTFAQFLLKHDQFDLRIRNNAGMDAREWALQSQMTNLANAIEVKLEEEFGRVAVAQDDDFDDDDALL